MITYLILLFILASILLIEDAEGAFALTTNNSLDPIINDPSLKIELVINNLHFPTSFAFLDDDDILFLEKEKGTVRRITDGKLLEDPLLNVSVAFKNERGMLGVTVEKNQNHTYVFLYYSEVKDQGNRLYRYELLENKLVNPKLLLDLPILPGSTHVGGAITIGPDGNLYLPIGDVDHRTQAQNVEDGPEPDGTGGILRVTQDGQPVKDQNSGKYILGNTYPLNLYYAYGVRNSFGIDFDPVTGILWDTENGPEFGDEINMVEPGFNSGWSRVQGIWEPGSELRGADKNRAVLEPHNLVDFNGKGKYSRPEFIWDYSVAPSALKFFNSSKFGEEYENDLFVGNVNEESLYHFDLSDDRMQLDLQGPLADRIAEHPNDTKSHVLGERLGRITDIEIGPDGNLYILSHEWYERDSVLGSIYRISNNTQVSFSNSTAPLSS